ncbi:MAG: 4-hydroxy-tetrahydrodipicolinate reductase [Desulfobacteraceae bacterium]|nr:4-hydroxy-tetrahydrodipicolinate reductase [Desulfobacteraceae bacterium]
MTIKVCVAGATGWAGSALSKGIYQTEDLELAGAVSRTHKGKTLQDVLGLDGCDLVISGSVGPDALAGCDVMVDYTAPEIAKQNILTALDAGVHVVVGTSGLTDEDYADIHTKALEKKRGVLAVGNFALTVVLLHKFAEMAAKYIPQWEIMDYAHDAKKDAPSGTAREMAHRLSKIRPSRLTVPLDQTQGVRETRGADMTGSQVHSVRLPGYTLSLEIIFGMPDQKLTLRHDAGSSAQPYVDGSLLAIRRVHTFTGLRRGLDQVMDLDEK